MNIIYQGYKGSLIRPEITVERLDLWNNTRYLNKFKKGKITLEEIARINHEKGDCYFVSFLEKDEPKCGIVLSRNKQVIRVQFRDTVGRDYLEYIFGEGETTKKPYLETVWYYHYPNNEISVYDDHDYRISFNFTENGDASYVVFDNLDTTQRTFSNQDYENFKYYKVTETFDISNLYENYPSFGQYENLIKLDRNIGFMNKLIKQE